jgi:cytidine deaminase
MNTNQTTDHELLRLAAAAARRAYAPYSQYPVGAALMAADGTVFVGCNVENASYGLTICAERAAVCAAVSGRRFKIIKVAIVGGTARQPAWPCGACRQVLAEFCDPATPILVAGRGRLDRWLTRTLGELLPESFRLNHGKRRP